MKKFSYFVSLVLAFSLLLIPTLQAATPKPGSACFKLGTSQVFLGKKYTCIKSGKKLLWNAGSVIQRSTPTPSPSSSSKSSTNSIISERDIEKSILANWETWRRNKLAGQPKVTVVLQSGYSKDWSDVTTATVQYLSNILDGNGLKLVQTPYWAYVETEEERLRVFKEIAPLAPCNPPYVPGMEEFIHCANFDIGSGGLRINKSGVPMANGYRLTERDKTLLTYFVAHDMAIFYEVQAQYGEKPYSGNMYQIPAWIREGTAQLIALLVTNDLRNSGGSYLDIKPEDRWFGTKPQSICIKDLQNAEGKDKNMPDECSRSMNLFAVSLLVSKFGGLEALFKFHTLYGQNTDWVKSFQESFGISREDFYREWWHYLGIPQSQWPNILAATPPERY